MGAAMTEYQPRSLSALLEGDQAVLWSTKHSIHEQTLPIVERFENYASF